MKKSKRQFAVIGLGRFGMSVAMTLSGAGYDVIAIDNDEERVQEIADEVTYALRADVTEAGVLEKIGISNVDAVVIGIAQDLGQSVMAIIRAKEAGAPYILAKALDPLRGDVLKKIGADEIIYPERDMGTRVAKKIISGNFLDLYELSKNFSMVEILVPAHWEGKNLIELDLRKKGINVIGLMEGEKVTVNLDPKMPLPAGATVIIVADNKILSNIEM